MRRVRKAFSYFPYTQHPKGFSAHKRVMDFIETTQYNAPAAELLSTSGSGEVASVPDPWRQYEHPNGDIYYYHPQLRLITPDNIGAPEILGYIMDAREDHLQCLADDPNLHILPSDYELVVSDVSETAAVLRMYSRSAGVAYDWREERGLARKSKEHFWSYVAEYPSHHSQLPLNTETEFIEAINNAKVDIQSGVVFAFSEHQIDQIIARYQYLTGKKRYDGFSWLAYRGCYAP